MVSGIRACAPRSTVPCTGTSSDKSAPEIDEAGDDQRVGEVDEERAYQRGDEECARSGAIALDQRTHYRHRIGSGAQHEADEAAAHDGGVIVPAHDPLTH